MLKKTLLLTVASLLTQNGLAASQLKSYKCNVCVDLDKTEVHYSWPISDKKITHIAPMKRSSLSYRIKANGKQLQEGVLMPTDAPQAVFKITPLNKNPQAKLQAQSLSLVAPSQHHYTLAQASKTMADAKALQASPYYGGEQLAFQIAPELGQGHFTLLAEAGQNLNSGDQYMLSVYDKNSSLALSMQTDKMVYRYGDDLQVKFSLDEGDKRFPIEEMQAFLVSPEGEKLSMNIIENDDGSYRAQKVLDSKLNARGQAWYVIVDVQTEIDGKSIKRRGQSAFAYAIPSAQIAKGRSLNTAHGLMSSDLSVNIDIEAINASRYEVEGTLYGMGDDGKMHPMMQAQSANWFEPGQHQLVLHFNQEYLKQSPFHAPFEVRYIRLIDQAQLAPVADYENISIR